MAGRGINSFTDKAENIVFDQGKLFSAYTSHSKRDNPSYF